MIAVKRVYDWMGTIVHSTYATLILAALFFIEAVFFVPVDPLLILFCIENRTRSFFYATVATISSVLGGITGYFIGLCVWEIIGQKLIMLIASQEKFDQALLLFKNYESLAVLVAGFTPFPYKLITLGAGFCKLPLLPFIICSLVSRGARFYLIALIIHTWGEEIREYIDRYFNLFVLLFTALLVGAVWMVAH